MDTQERAEIDLMIANIKKEAQSIYHTVKESVLSDEHCVRNINMNDSYETLYQSMTRNIPDKSKLLESFEQSRKEIHQKEAKEEAMCEAYIQTLPWKVIETTFSGTTYYDSETNSIWTVTNDTLRLGAIKPEPSHYQTLQETHDMCK